LLKANSVVATNVEAFPIKNGFVGLLENAHTDIVAVDRERRAATLNPLICRYRQRITGEGYHAL
jgi:hypothetical protein